MRHFMISLLVAIVAMTATAQGNKADYRVVPLPDRIDGIKGADFRLTEQSLVNYPAGDRNMERNAAMLSHYVEQI